MHRAIRIVLLVSLLVVGLVVPSLARAQPHYYRWASAVYAICTDLGGSIQVTVTSQPVEWDLPAGNKIIMTHIRNGAATVYPPFSMPPGVGSDDSGTFTSLVPGAYPIVFSEQLDTYVNGAHVYRSTLTVSCSADGLSDPPTLVNQEITGPAPVPGPDMVSIPSGAVVGAFVTSTPAYFEPQTGAETNIVIEAGKTLWVLGVDASGSFYKVMLSGRFFWVPVNTMGPNFDEVWQGRPLPTAVVE